MKTLLWLVLFGLGSCAANAAWKAGDKLEILWGGKWYPGVVIEADGEKTKIRYDGYSSVWDEWVPAERLRPPVVKAEPIAATASTPVAAAEPKPRTFSWPAPPAGAKTGLQGAWLRVETYFWGSSLSINNHGWFFTKSGRVSRAPSGGFDFKAFEASTEAGENDGAYWIEGETLTVKWADGSAPTEYSFKRKGGEVVIAGIGCTPVEGFKKGWRFDGEYEGGASVGGGAVANSNTLVFRRDGTFARSAVGSFSVTSAQSTVSGGSQGESAGTYEFDGYTLRLACADGAVKTHTVFAFGDRDGGGRPEYIYRDGTMMRNQDAGRASK